MMRLKKLLHFIRQLSGDDAYDRYLHHWQYQHADKTKQPLSRAEFFKAEVERKWNGVKRCC